MRAVVTENKKLVLRDNLPQPKPGDGQVLVRTKACGICGSDLHALTQGERMGELARRSGGGIVADFTRPMVYGHEFSAQLLEHGPNTKKTCKADSLVVSMPILLSANGIETVGYSNDFPGGFGEYMVLQEELLLPVPNGLSAEHAAMTEPMAVGAHAVNTAQLDKSHIALILGLGPIGLSVLLSLKAKGFGPVIAADFAPERRKLAEQLGADYVIDPAKESPHQHWEALGVKLGALERMLAEAAGEASREAVIFECVGVPGIIEQLVNDCPPHSRIIVVGVCMERDKFEPFIAINKQVELRFVLGYTAEEFSATLGGIAEGKLPVAPLHSQSVGLEGVSEAFTSLSQSMQQVKILVCPHM